MRLEAWIKDQRRQLRKAQQDGGAEEGGRANRRNRRGAEEETDIDRLRDELRNLLKQRNELLGKDAEEYISVASPPNMLAVGAREKLTFS